VLVLVTDWGGARGVRYRVQKAILSQEDIAMDSGGQLQGDEKGEEQWRRIKRCIGKKAQEGKELEEGRVIVMVQQAQGCHPTSRQTSDLLPKYFCMI
jgi:hypothetical protein